MSWTLLIIVVHVFGAMAMVAGVIGRELTRIQMRATHDFKTFLGLLELTGRFDKLLVQPTGFVIALSGIALAVIEGYPLFGFLQGGQVNWLLAANLLVITILLLVVFVFVPRGRRYDVMLQEAKRQGEITPALRAEDRDPVVVWAHRVENAATLLIVFLMVTKPF